MMAYGHPTPKRQQAKSNWKAIANLDTGRIAAATMRDQTQYSTTSSDLGLESFMSCLS